MHKPLFSFGMEAGVDWETKANFTSHFLTTFLLFIRSSENKTYMDTSMNYFATSSSTLILKIYLSAYGKNYWKILATTMNEAEESLSSYSLHFSEKDNFTLLEADQKQKQLPHTVFQK